jgi:hypothetical protein
MIEAVNPFTDPEFKKQILGDKGPNSADYETIDDITESESLKSIISGAPVIPNEKKFSNLILDASAIAKNEKEAKAQEVSMALNTVFTNYNKKYGLNLNINLNSLSQTLVNVSDDKSRRVLELYLSKTFKSFKSIMILHLLSRLSLALDYITDPQRMFSSEFTLADIFLATNQILGFIDQLTDLKKEIEITGDDLELQKIAEQDSSVDLDSDESKATIQSFMDLFNKEHNGN